MLFYCLIDLSPSLSLPLEGLPLSGKLSDHNSPRTTKKLIMKPELILSLTSAPLGVCGATKLLSEIKV